MKKKILSFLQATILGGLFVLLPVVLLIQLLGEAMKLVIALATPIADLFPKGTFDEVRFPIVIAILLLVAASFVLGLLMRSAWATRCGRWIEQRALIPVPGYRALKGLTRSFSSATDAAGFKPALLRSPSGVRELAYVIEDSGDDFVTVLVPWAPTPLAGSVKIVPRDQVEILPAPLAEMTRVLSQWGFGVRDLLARRTEGTGPRDARNERLKP